MNRRKFLAAGAAGIGASKLNLSAPQDSAANEKPREYYELRHYHVQSGRQQKITDAFLRDALIPALIRLGVGPVGVFTVDIGESSAHFYVLLPAPSVDVLATAEARLGLDADYVKAGAPFLSAPHISVVTPVYGCIACLPALYSRLRAALATEVTGATMIIVAQRVSTIRHADQILVLDGGRLVASGTHAELMATSATYREIVLSQLTEQEAAA